jgi:mycothiol synthase
MRLRHPTFDDAEAIHAVLRARDIADIGRPDFSLEDVLTDWEMPGIDPAQDCFVAEDDGAIAGYALVDRRGAVVSVHPDFERRGIGTALREAVERRMSERGQTLSQGIVSANVTAVEHLRAAGYERRRIFQRMRAPLDVLPSPDGAVFIRPFDLDEEGVAAHALIELAFTEIEGNDPEFYEEWLVWVRRQAAPQYLLAVDDDDGMAAAIIGARWEDGVGYVAEIATARRARGRGYGRALLLALAEAFRREGLKTLELSVHGANAPALGLYTGIGMTPDFRAERWERPA